MAVNPEVIKHIELLIGSIGVILGLFFGTFLLIKKKQLHKANLFLSIYLLALSLRVGKSLFYNYFSIPPILGNLFFNLLLAVGPSLWFYAIFLNNPDSRINKKEILLHYSFVPVFISFYWILPTDSTLSWELVYLGRVIHILCYCFLILYRIQKSKSVSQRIRKWLFVLVSVTIVIALMHLFVYLKIAPYIATIFVYTGEILFLSIYAFKNLSLFTPEFEKYSNSSLSNEKAVVFKKKLDTLMQKDKLFLDPELTLDKLSSRMGISSKQLSQAINQVQNENYSQYITKYRVEESKRLLRDPKYANYKIAAIAYDSGFNSISSFNASFKKLTNTTAIKYRQSL